MKKVVILLLAFILCGCGAGSYSVSSGKADEGMLSFTEKRNIPIVVSVDGKNYEVSTIKTKEWQKDRNIKRTVKNTIYVPTGKHEIIVYLRGNEIYHKTLFISASEHKIISL